MYCGQIVEEADVRTFFQSPKHPYTQALIQASPDPEKKIDQLMAIKGTVRLSKIFRRDVDLRSDVRIKQNDVPK